MDSNVARSGEAVGSAAERDRRVQIFLAQARGPRRNGDLLRQAVDRALRIQAANFSPAGVKPVDDALVDTLAYVVDVLEGVGADYAVTGSVASSVHGEPWSSLGADLIVRASGEQMSAFGQRMSPRFYAAAETLAETARAGGFANVVDNQTGLKVDLSFVGTDGFLQAVLGRRKAQVIGSHPRKFWFVTAEDVILMKLVWRQGTQSAKQWENALGVARVRGARMDWTFLFEQARMLGVEDDLIRLRDEAGI